jgi:hypothetical protein
VNINTQISKTKTMTTETATEKTATMKVMKADDQPKIQELSAEERQDLINAIQEEMDARNKEITEKYYIVDGGAAAGEKFVEFLDKEAQWKFTEAIGVLEAIKEINVAIAKAKTDKNLFLQVLPLEALWFFINKIEGAGAEKAKAYHDNLLKPVAEALGRVKADRDAINALAMRQGALEAGADFEAPQA